MQLIHAGRALRAVTTREIVKFVQQRGRLLSGGLGSGGIGSGRLGSGSVGSGRSSEIRTGCAAPAR